MTLGALLGQETQVTTSWSFKLAMRAEKDKRKLSEYNDKTFDFIPSAMTLTWPLLSNLHVGIQEEKYGCSCLLVKIAVYRVCLLLNKMISCGIWDSPKLKFQIPYAYVFVRVGREFHFFFPKKKGFWFCSLTTKRTLYCYIMRVSKILASSTPFTIRNSISELAPMYDAFILDQYGVLHNGESSLEGAV